MVESPSDDMLPAGLFVLPVVQPSSAMERNKVKVLIRNETCKDITIPVGTVIAHMFHTDMVAAASDFPTKPKKIDPKLFDFSKS